jgi:OOP family OmpA-OmpF porin
VSVTPSATTTYTLTCNGPGGTTSSTANVALAGCPVVLTPEQEEVVDLHIQFDFNKTEVKPQYAPNIDALGDFMKKYPCDVTLEGHTDNVGGMAYNQDLSQRRADAVKNYLVEKFGIDSNRIKTVGYGETKPIASNDTEAGRYQNRRVQARHAAIKK